MADIRTADQLELISEEIGRVQATAAEQTAQLKNQMRDIIRDAQLGEEELAEIYWRLESVPVAWLGPPAFVRAVAQRYPYWSWRCECGTEVDVASRSELQQRQRGKGHYWTTCESCRKLHHAHRDGQWKAEVAARVQRESELRTMPYREYLQTPEWQERRKAALKRAGFACQVCNRGNRVLHVHHRTYERRGVELARDLIVLCDECHALYHGKGLLAGN